MWQETSQEPDCGMNINTERLELRPITLDSLDALADLFSDELVKQT